ncbi:MAG: hypothetical protein LQ350_000666 [Teloschistes chrysophthalmus]|nr:MAG: hypothetical protein LQ350_000666 [Niorma chrysophthalma]
MDPSSAWGQKKVENMFSMKENKSHAARKRMLSNVFSKSFLQSSKDALEMTRLIVFDRLLPTLDSSAVKDSPVEVYELNYGTTMDFVSSYLFGVSNDANFILDVEMRKRFLGWYWGRPDHSFWIQELPRLTQIFRSIGINLVPKWVHAANAEIEAWLLGKCQAAEQTINAASEYSEKAHGTHPIVYGQLRDSVKKSRTESGSGEKTDCSVQEETLIASELLDHVGAGMDTSGITLTYIYWEMSRNPELQDRLRKELLTLSPTLEMRNRSTLPSARSVDALPLLHAIVMETLRRHGAIPGSQPRITPSTPTSVAGSPPLPGGVRISAQAYSLHRNEQVFPEPEAWRPERWLDADPSQKEKMMRWFWAFGSGPRMCVGSNLAMHEIKYVTAAVYSNFSTSIVDDSGMDQVDSYTAGPEGEELILKFSRIQ